LNCRTYADPDAVDKIPDPVPRDGQRINEASACLADAMGQLGATL
jgi:hypothetical protein